MKFRFSILFLIIVAVACCGATSTDFTSGDPAFASGEQITITPPAGPPGSSITIEGTGFPPGADYGWAIIFYGNIVAGGSVTSSWIEADEQGDFNVQGRIPYEAGAGVHGIKVFFNPDNHGVYDPMNPNQVWAQWPFTVIDRQLTMVPNDVPFGTHVTLSGGDFGSDAHGEIPQLWINDQRVYLDDIDDQELSSGGNIVPATFQISADMNFHYGENLVEIRVLVNGATQSASTMFNVARPTLEIEPTQGPRGTKVTATGSGWLTGMTDFVTLSYDRADTPENEDVAVAIVRANEYGDIWAQFTIPPLWMGEESFGLVICADDAEGNSSLETTFTIISPCISVEPEAGWPGEEVVVTGTGFQPKTQIQEVSIGDAPIIPVYELGLTGAQGQFAVSGIVPGVMPGTRLVKVRVTQDDDNPVTYPFVVLPGPPDDPTVEVGLASIDGLYTTLWTFNAALQEWQVYQPDLPPWVPVFTRLNRGQGYWIKVTEDCALTYGANTWNLKTTWNLIGWLG